MFLHRLDGLMPEGAEISNYSFAFTRPLDRNDSGVYRCEVLNDLGLRSLDVNLWVQGMLLLFHPLLNWSEILFKLTLQLASQHDQLSFPAALIFLVNVGPRSTFTRSSPQSSRVQIKSISTKHFHWRLGNIRFSQMRNGRWFSQVCTRVTLFFVFFLLRCHSRIMTCVRRFIVCIRACMRVCLCIPSAPLYCLVKSCSLWFCSDLIVMEVFIVTLRIKANKLKGAFFGLSKGDFQCLALLIHWLKL